MKIVYLTWGETPRAYGVFGSQVIGQFFETSKLSKMDEFHFVSAVPVIHSGLVREKWRYFKELNSVKKKLGLISFHWLPVLAPQNLINSNKSTFNMFHGVSHFFLKKKLAKLDPDIVHCRSYHAAWAALSVKKKHGLSFKIIFDGRGLWPEEVALKSNWQEDSADYLFLKCVEKTLLTECDVSVSVSDTMHNHYISLGARNDQCIYLSADIEQLKLDITQFSKSEAVRFCYVGALSEDTWHQPKVLVDLYRELRHFFDKTQLTIVTTSNHEYLRDLFSEFPEEELVFTSTITREELKEVLGRQDLGLLPYRKQKTQFEALVGNTMLATKTAEYLVSGLPMICNSCCGGAAKILEEYGLGVVYSPDDLNGLSYETIIPYLKVNSREKCQLFALDNFDYKLNAEKYFKIYSDILKK